MRGKEEGKMGLRESHGAGHELLLEHKGCYENLNVIR